MASTTTVPFTIERAAPVALAAVCECIPGLPRVPSSDVAKWVEEHERGVVTVCLPSDGTEHNFSTGLFTNLDSFVRMVSRTTGGKPVVRKLVFHAHRGGTAMSDSAHIELRFSGPRVRIARKKAVAEAAAAEQAPAPRKRFGSSLFAAISKVMRFGRSTPSAPAEEEEEESGFPGEEAFMAESKELGHAPEAGARAWSLYKELAMLTKDPPMSICLSYRVEGGAMLLCADGYDEINLLRLRREAKRLWRSATVVGVAEGNTVGVRIRLD